MRCNNCLQQIEVGAYQCPYCRHNPTYPAWADRGTREDRVRTPGEASAALALMAAGALLAPVLPVAGVPILAVGCLGVAATVVRYFRRDRR